MLVFKGDCFSRQTCRYFVRLYAPSKPNLLTHVNGKVMLSVDVLSYNVRDQAHSRDIQGLIDRIARKRPAIICLHNVNQRVLDQIRDSPVVETYFVPKRPDLKPLGNLILARHKLTEIHTNRFGQRQGNQGRAGRHQGRADVDRAANMTTGVVYVPMGEGQRGKEEPVFVSAVTLSASSAAWRERQDQWRDILHALDREPRVLISVCSNCSYRGKDSLDIPDDCMLAEDKQNRDVQVVFRTENEAEFRNVSYFETSDKRVGLEVELLNDTTRFYDEGTPSQENDDYTPSPSPPLRPRMRNDRDRDRNRTPPPSRRSGRPSGRNRDRDPATYSSEEEEYGLYSDEGEGEDDKASGGLRAVGRNYDRGRNLRVLDERDAYSPDYPQPDDRRRPSFNQKQAPRDRRSRWDNARHGFSFDRPRDAKKRDRRRTPRDAMREEEIQNALDKRAQIDHSLRRGFSRNRAEEARKLGVRALSRRVFGKRHDEVGSRRETRPIDEVRKLTESERRAVDKEWKHQYGKSRKDIERINRMDRRALARQVIFQGDKNDDADERKYTRHGMDEDMARLQDERQKQEKEFTQNLDDYYGERRPRSRTNSSRQQAPRRRARYD